jgi:FkbM family methyltransferase
VQFPFPYVGKLSENRFTRPIKRSIVRSIVSKNGPRSILNRFYGLLGDEAKSRFHARYSKIFRDDGVALASGEWTVDFINRKIRLPLRPSCSWLDWDNAVSIIGHDIEIKQTYEALITSDQRPEIFIDVGANYGMHSVLFLSAGIQAIAFEPNQRCFSTFQYVCELNGFTGRWEQVAIGHRVGQVELVYPEKETWLGSVSSEAVPILKKSDGMMTTQVSLKMLDDYLSDIPRGRVLIKIDVEGFECEVIEGASRLLRDRKPKLIFESNNAKARPALLRLLAGYGYAVSRLPWGPSVAPHSLDVDEFLASPSTNFIAIPRST